MSWIKIERDNEIITVPYQAFKDLYERHGFKVVSEPIPTHIETQKNIDKNKVVVEGEKENVKQKPSNKPNKK